ncbi:hypothetical protein [uncultured Mitsuokella sp.]|uniref:hypothetical protein n=1 Tax=uncultured Mitsuokella sp. TaxID=453120 RepID=UPI00262E912A|nr:hypothetical protein [uncultured Mitsuokella sp.]
MENQLEKYPMPKEEELLAILPESGMAGENGTRIIARRAAFWVPNCVSYVLRYYAAREGARSRSSKRRTSRVSAAWWAGGKQGRTRGAI